MSTAPTPGLDPALERLFEAGEPRRGAPLNAAERKSEALMGALFVAVAAWLALGPDTGRDVDWTTALLLMLGFALATRVEFAVGAGYTVPTQLVFVPLLFLLPPELVPLFVAAGFLIGNAPDYLRGTTHPSRALLSLGDAWYAVGPALVFSIADPGAPAWGDWPVYLGALASQFAGDLLGSVLREWLALRVAATVQIGLLAWVWLVDALLAPLGLLAASAAHEQEYAYLLALPLLGLLSLFARERKTRIEQALELSSAYKGTALLLGDVVEADDEYTGAHSRGVLDLALTVAESMGLPPYAQRQVEFAALLHDVGKIHIPKEIINKPGKLDDEEWEVMKTHTIEGQQILERVGGVLAEVGRIVRACHERYDGKGYPEGLAAREIPVAARIVFACDAFNAMTTTRSYRKALPLEVALGELEANAGTQFDPEVVGHIVRIVRRGATRFAGESLTAQSGAKSQRVGQAVGQ